MKKVSMKLSVFFENPFWVGLFEREEAGNLSVCRYVFGVEPKTNEIYRLILQDFVDLDFSPTVEVTAKEKRVNPKRMQRENQKAMQQMTTSTKAQEALQAQLAFKKKKKHELSKKQKQCEKDHRFQLRQEKKKEKHKGH